MENQFDFLPRNALIFLDTSVFDIEYGSLAPSQYKFPRHLRALHVNAPVKIRLARMNGLSETLSEIDNWLAIPEVIEESRWGIQKIGNEIRNNKKEGQNYEDAQRIRKARRRILNLLISRMEHPVHLLSELDDKMMAFYPQIEAYFSRSRGKTNRIKTDTRVIAYAFAYSEIYHHHYSADPACIWTTDGGILRTLKEVANFWNIPMSAINESKKEVMPLRNYDRGRLVSIS